MNKSGSFTISSPFVMLWGKMTLREIRFADDGPDHRLVVPSLNSESALGRDNKMILLGHPVSRKIAA